MTNILHNADCLEILRTLPDNSIDAIVTDPPYYSTNLKFDKEPRLDFKNLLLELKRVLKQNGVLVSFCDLNLLIELKQSNVFNSCYEIIWQKNQPQGYLHSKVRPLRNHEYILVLYDNLKSTTYNPQKFNYQSSRFKLGDLNGCLDLKPAEHYGSKRKKTAYYEDGTRYPLSVVYAQNWNGGFSLARKELLAKGFVSHPTQKPLDLVEYLIKTYSNEHDIILDPFMGSGTTGIACKNLNRSFIGIEREPEYFETAQARIKNAK